MPARLIEYRAPARPEGVVLVLHGGAGRGASAMVSATQLSVLRMIPIARRARRAGHGRLAVARLLNSARGWDPSRTPVDDALWALQRIAERYGPDLPVCLIGHSLGGRAALLAAAAPQVRSAVALNPWVYRTDAPSYPAPRSVLVLHGSADRIASPAASALVAARLARTAEVRFVEVTGGKHAMLRRHGAFDGLAAQFAAGTLLSDLDHRPALRPILDAAGRVSV